MSRVLDHIERIKKQPHHVRKQITFGAAGLGTALIALVWLVGNLSAGRFAIQPNSFADSVNGQAVVTVDSTGQKQVAGAAEALQSGNILGTRRPAAHIQIVDTSTTTTSKQAERTIIPF
jgi:hypothetical protein